MAEIDEKIRQIRELEGLKVHHQKMMLTRRNARKRREMICTYLSEIESDAVILDFGCAEGMYVEHMNKFKKYYGVDLSETKIKRAKDKYHGLKNAEFLAGGIDEVKKLNIKFDFILCAEVIQHVLEYKPLIKDLLEFLVVNGRLLITAPNYSLYPKGHMKSKFNLNDSVENLSKIIGGAGIGRSAGIWKFSLRVLIDEIDIIIRKIEGEYVIEKENIYPYVINIGRLCLLKLSRSILKIEYFNPYGIIMIRKIKN